MVNDETRRKFKDTHESMKTQNMRREKIARETRRNRIKEEVKQEPREQMMTNREREKKHFIESHAA